MDLYLDQHIQVDPLLEITTCSAVDYLVPFYRLTSSPPYPKFVVICGPLILFSIAGFGFQFIFPFTNQSSLDYVLFQ